MDATLEKVYGRMDGFAAEVKQFVAKQQDKWKAASDTHKDLHSGLASLRGDTVRATPRLHVFSPASRAVG